MGKELYNVYLFVSERKKQDKKLKDDMWDGVVDSHAVDNAWKERCYINCAVDSR